MDSLERSATGSYCKGVVTMAMQSADSSYRSHARKVLEWELVYRIYRSTYKKCHLAYIREKQHRLLLPHLVLSYYYSYTIIILVLLHTEFLRTPSA